MEEFEELSRRVAILEQRADMPVRDGHPLWKPDETEPSKLICPRCNVDRLKTPCPGPLHLCPMIGEAQNAEPPISPASSREDLLEQLYWEFNAERSKKTRDERLIFKGKLRWFASNSDAVSADTLQAWSDIIQDQEKPIGNRLQEISAKIHFALHDKPRPELTEKEGWWNGARAGLGISPDAPRTEVAKMLKDRRATATPASSREALVCKLDFAMSTHRSSLSVLHGITEVLEECRADLTSLPPQAANPVPILWYKPLIGTAAKPTGECYDIRFCPTDGFQPLGIIGTPMSVPEGLAADVVEFRDGFEPTSRAYCTLDKVCYILTEITGAKP